MDRAATGPDALWNVLEPALTRAIRKWCDPDDVSALAQEHLVRDVLQDVRAEIGKTQTTSVLRPK